ncbi:MAG: antibiotic biosynthesis monooxygenase [Chloroflexi bacterium]|nr:MAG: antibiotic biosynthesis monooxygenase [Chloroflexota bacterium]
MYGLFGKMRSHPGKRDALIAHLLHAANLLRGLDGCYIYIISSSPDDPNGIWVTEMWRSQDDHRASLTHQAVQDLITVARPLIAETSERYEFTPLGGKGLPDE